MTQITGRVVSPNGGSAHGAWKQAPRLDRFFSDRLNFDQLPVWTAGITACGATSPVRMIGRMRCGLVPPPLLPRGVKPMTNGQPDGIVAVIDDDTCGTVNVPVAKEFDPRFVSFRCMTLALKQSA